MFVNKLTPKLDYFEKRFITQNFFNKSINNNFVI